jgi:hypothetical protein
MARCAPERSQIFAETRRFVWRAIRFVHHGDPAECLAWYQGEPLMEPERSLIGRKLQDDLAKAKELEDAVTDLPLWKHWPNQPLHESGEDHSGNDTKVDACNGLEHHWLLGIQGDGADGAK